MRVAFSHIPFKISEMAFLEYLKLIANTDSKMGNFERLVRGDSGNLFNRTSKGLTE